jgi:CRISPR-associated protein Csd1
MLLTRLVAYAESLSEAPPLFYGTKTIRWVVELNPDGSLASRHLTDLADPDDRSRRNGVPHLVPLVQRSGTAAQPMLLVDTAEYTLGWSSDDKRAAKAKTYHAAFADLVQQWHKADPGPDSAAVWQFLISDHAASLVRDSALAGNHIVAFRCGAGFAHASESARTFWATEAARRKASTRTGLCLVCGQNELLLQTIPQQLPTRLVPGATNNAALVSLNKPTHVFALDEQLAHTPICVRCGLQTMTALETLLGGRSSATYPAQDTRLTWWVTDNTPFDITTLDDPKPVRIAELLGSAARGTPPGNDDLTMFCALAIGGNVARVVVREWIEQPLPRIRDNLESWFSDHQIIDTWTGQPRHIGVSRMALAAGRWIPSRDEGTGRYTKFGATGADRPDEIYRALMTAALLRAPLPHRLLAHMIHRVTTDGRVDTERAALIRLALRRHPTVSDHEKENYMPMLNPDHHKSAYLAGRIFAVLGDLQYRANKARGSEPLNTTFTDRYFGRAVTSPAVALVTGRRTARAWLRVLRNQQATEKTAHFIERKLDDLFAQLDDAGGMPHGTVLAEKAAFILGYHQERATRAKNPMQSTDNDAPQGEPA